MKFLFSQFWVLVIVLLNTGWEESRPFLMGMTPFPFDLSETAQDETYKQLSEYTDLILHHMDTGIPWEEALTGEPYHPAVMRNIEERIAHIQPSQRVYLSITPNAAERSQIAGYWGADESMPLSEAWRERSFDDPEVITAFLNHARFMIEQFQPDYFAYGIEVTCAYRGEEDTAFQEFLAFAKMVYPTLKAEYPDLVIFATICAISVESDDIEALVEAGREVVAYSDLIGLSIYPYLFGNIGLEGIANPSTLTDDWLSRWATIDPQKPFAITETGYIAQDLIIPEFGISVKGTEGHQAEYVQRLLKEAQRLDAEFVIWFVLRDYDAFVQTVEVLGIETQNFLLWRDTGLIDEAGVPRPASQVWIEWLAKERAG
jgi:hypothetical protein